MPTESLRALQPSEVEMLPSASILKPSSAKAYSLAKGKKKKQDKTHPSNLSDFFSDSLLVMKPLGLT